MDLALDPLTGDIALSNGDLRLVDGDEAVAQYLAQSLQIFLGEWFLDQSEGVPYHDEVFVKNPQAVVIDTIFKDRIMDAPGVQELVSYTSQLDGPTRQLTVTFQARSQSGTLINFSVTGGQVTWHLA